MRSGVVQVLGGVVVAVIGFGAVTAVGPAVAYAEPGPGCDGGCNISPNLPGFGRTGSTDSTGGGGGSGGYQPTVPEFTPPESTVSGQDTVVVRRTPKIPDDVPPGDLPQPPEEPAPVDIPVDLPQVPVDIPVTAGPVVPVAVPIAPPPVEVPIPPPPPAAPPLPTPPRVLLTSSAEPAGSQALTVILILAVVGAWIYGHRIASHWTSGKKTDAPTAA